MEPRTNWKGQLETPNAEHVEGAKVQLEINENTRAEIEAALEYLSDDPNDPHAREFRAKAAIDKLAGVLPAAGSLPSPKATRNPWSSWTDAQALGGKGLEQYRAIMTAAAGDGVRAIVAPLKGEGRATAKVEGDYGGDWGKLKDMVRGTLAVRTLADLPAAIERAKAAGVKFAAEPKNNFANPTTAGYRDINALVELPNGVVAELQFNTEAMLVAKEEAHDFYARAAELERKNGTATPDGEWPSEDKAEWESLLEKQRAIYDAAWQASIGG
jgi:hypothetical protein